MAQLDRRWSTSLWRCQRRSRPQSACKWRSRWCCSGRTCLRRSRSRWKPRPRTAATIIHSLLLLAIVRSAQGRRGVFAVSVARDNRLIPLVLARVIAGVVLGIIRVTADQEIVEVDIMIVAAAGVLIEQLQLRDGAGIRTGEGAGRAATGRHDQLIGAARGQNELDAQAGPLERNAGIALRTVVVLVVGSAAQEVELQDVRPAGSLQAKAHLAAAVHVAVVEINAHDLFGRQGGERTNGHFVAAEPAPHAQRVAAGAVDVVGRGEAGASRVAEVIVGGTGGEGGTAAAGGPGAAPAAVVMSSPGIMQA